MMKSIFCHIIIFFLFVHSFLYPTLLQHTLIKTKEGFKAIEHMKVGNFVTTQNNTAITNARIKAIKLKQFDTIYEVKTNKGLLYTSEDQKFFDPLQKNGYIQVT